MQVDREKIYNYNNKIYISVDVCGKSKIVLYNKDTQMYSYCAFTPEIIDFTNIYNENKEIVDFLEKDFNKFYEKRFSYVGNIYQKLQSNNLFIVCNEDDNLFIKFIIPYEIELKEIITIYNLCKKSISRIIINVADKVCIYQLPSK